MVTKPHRKQVTEETTENHKEDILNDIKSANLEEDPTEVIVEEQVQTGQPKEPANFVPDVSHEVNEETEESDYTEEGDYAIENDEGSIDIGNTKETGQAKVELVEKSE
ncbi:unnamed protein product [Hymenolepis diminuta]|uniref:GAGE domain-containing protein n=1 Tax=Hymenolepis diminuta TaxID=6216 RepID=A0A0R3SS34_HYMDI|nr:unnamed protein product [Hymenolepis diminuta]VUZ50211.1 unnamed protein product [Hymenolepis diminuta]